MPPIQFLLLFAALGGVVGFAAGLLGIGGGGIAVPALTALFMAMGLPRGEVVHLALGTSMAAMIVTAFSSMRSHYRRGNVLVPVVRALAPGIITGTFTYLFLIRCSVFSAVLISKIPQMRIQPCIHCVRMIFINTVHARILYTGFFSDNIQFLCKIIFRILTVHLYIKWKFHL